MASLGGASGGVADGLPGDGGNDSILGDVGGSQPDFFSSLTGGGGLPGGLGGGGGLHSGLGGLLNGGGLPGGLGGLGGGDLPGGLGGGGLPGGLGGITSLLGGGGGGLPSLGGLGGGASAASNPLDVMSNFGGGGAGNVLGDLPSK